MKWFDRLVVLQMLVYWVFAPLFSLYYTLTTFNAIHFAPYIACILAFVFLKRKYPDSEKLTITDLNLGDWRTIFFIGFAIHFLISNELAGRFVFGEAQLRNANFTFGQALLYKSIEVGIPLILCYKISKKQKKLLDYVTFLGAVLTLLLMSGPSKAVIASVALYYILFSKKQLSIKSIFILVVVLSIAFVLIFLIREEQQGIEIIYYLISRLDGIYLVSSDPLNTINLFTGDVGYLSSYFNSVTRFFDQQSASLFSMGIVGAKPEYLYRLGHLELDATISMPSEMIMIFGYLPGIFITLIVLLVSRSIIARTLAKSTSPYITAFGFSVFLNVISFEQSIFSTILNPFKIFPILVILVFLLGSGFNVNEKRS